MQQKFLDPPRGFRRVLQPKASGGFRAVYPYQRKKDGSEEAMFWSSKAKKAHQRFLLRENIRRRQAALAYRSLPDDWRIRYEDDECQQQLQEVEDAYFREVQFESCLEKVREHTWSGPYFMKLDIENAFGAVTYGRYTQFTNDGWVRNREIPVYGRIYHGWPFFHPKDGGLIQGAPTSPYLFERYCLISGFDAWLRDYSWANKFTITRYVDDIVLSSGRPFGTKVKRTLRRAFADWGFTFSDAKCQKINTENQPIEFLGAALFRGLVTPKSAFLKEPMTKGRRAWYNQVMAVNV